MKKLIGITLGLLLAVGISTTASAQIQVGGGIGFATEIENLGFQAGGTYVINEDIRVAADIIYYLPGDQGQGVVDVNWFEFNANGHYLFQDEDDLKFYGLGGINFTRVSIDFPENQFFGGGSVSDTEVGLNVGAGLEYGLGFGNLYAEAKYVLSSADHLTVTGGLRFPIGN